MDEQESDASSQSPWRFQFSLRTLLVMVAVVALLLGMWTWKGELGALQFFLGAGLVLIAVGLWQRRPGLIVLGVVVLIGIQGGLRFSARRTAVTTSTGWHEIAVPLRIVDAESGSPIAGAAVRILSGPAPADRLRCVATDADGQAEVDGKLSSVNQQYETLFGTFGGRFVSFSGVLAEIEAEGYRSRRVCLSEHFGQRRDLPCDRLPRATVHLQRIGAPGR